MAGTELAIRLLGPVELWVDGSTVAAGGPTQRAVLALLALHAGEPVPIDALSDGIWGEGDEPLSGKAIQVHVSRLRRLLPHGPAQPLGTVPGGYRLDPVRVSVDSLDFERLLSEGRRQRAAGDAAAARVSLDAALGRWRGPALMDVRDFPFAAQPAFRLDELRVDAAEERITARLALGEHAALVPELKALIAEHPYRERLHGQLMVALYRAGQQAAALEAYTAARRRLVLDLGVEPGPELAQLQQQILAQDSQLGAPSPPTSLAGPVTVQRPISRLRPAPDLIGRETLLEELGALAASERLITLTGAGGSGKTVLALTLLHRLAPRYPDGAAFVDLAAVSSPEQVLPAVAAGLGISPQVGALAGVLAAVVAERRLIVVLDNCEHLLDAVDELGPLVAATAGLFIATSRTPLGLHVERVVGVPPLPVPDRAAADVAAEPAVRLFLRAATNAGAGLGTDPDELAAAAAICRALDGLPLAIEIAAAQTRVESVAELAVSLGERLPSLPARGRDVPARQRTLESAVDWSLERLQRGQRRAFTRLAVFAGGFDARGAAAVLERDRPATIEMLTALLDASLLVRQPPVAGQARFRMLEPLRSVAAASAAPAEWAIAAARHATFLAAEVERLCPPTTGIQRPEDLAQLRTEHANLMAALDHLSEADPERAVDLLVGLSDYWLWTGTSATLRTLAGSLLRSNRLSLRASAETLALGAQASEPLGDHETAVSMIDRAVVLAARLTEPRALALIRQTECWIAMDSGDSDRAEQAARAALAHAEASGDATLMAHALNTLGAFEKRPEYRTRVEEALNAARAAEPMPLAEIVLLKSLSGYYSYVEPDAGRAEQASRSALALANRVGAPEFAAHLANNVGSHAVRAGSIEEGRALLVTALRTMDRIEHRLSALYPLSGLGEAEAALGRWEDALVLFTAVDALAARMGYGVAGLSDPSDFEIERSIVRTAERRLGREIAARARARGEAMTYREAVDFALEIGLRPSEASHRPGERQAEQPVVLMFTDIAGSTPLVEAVGDVAWAELAAWHERTLRELLAHHAGHEVDHAGDSFFAWFSDLPAAIDCAIAIQRRLREQRRQHGFAPRLRVGLHTASVQFSDGQLRGRGVHVAARVAAAASADEILVTADSLESTERRYPRAEPRTLNLRGLAAPVTVVPIDWQSMSG